jgi:hypothetical protein
MTRSVWGLNIRTKQPMYARHLQKLYESVCRLRIGAYIIPHPGFLLLILSIHHRAAKPLSLLRMRCLEQTRSIFMTWPWELCLETKPLPEHVMFLREKKSRKLRLYLWCREEAKRTCRRISANFRRYGSSLAVKTSTACKPRLCYHHLIGCIVPKHCNARYMGGSLLQTLLCCLHASGCATSLHSKSRELQTMFCLVVPKLKRSRRTGDMEWESVWNQK